MALCKLDTEQKQLLSKKLEELNALHQEAIEKDVQAYEYDWCQLERDIMLAMLSYRHILSHNECL